MIILIIIIIIIILLVYIFLLKRILNKKRKEYIYFRKAPTQDSPAYVGKIIKGYVDGNDIISTILDLNMKGFIDIHERNINGKLKRVLSYTGKNKNTELEEHEIFLINQLFKDNDEIFLEDYISSDKLKNDFKTFERMLERKEKRYIIKKESTIKNVTKIIFLITFSILGISIFYAIVQPFMIFILKDTCESIVYSIIISLLIHLLIAYKYISYINTKKLIKNILTAKIAYIFCFVILLILVSIINYDEIIKLLQNELVWYKMIISFMLSIITLLYMFGIINYKDENNYFLYFIIAFIFLEIILNCKVAICINIILLSIYSFMVTPKYINLKDEEYMDKWISFKRFLENYSMIKDKEEKDVLIWKEYLIYAISMGVNKNIVKKYANLAHINLFNKEYYKKFYKEYID